MTRETKIGLLVGLAFIIVIGILLSDHLTSATEPPQAPLVQAGGNVRTGVMVPGAAAAPPITNVQNVQQVAPRQPLPTQEELRPKKPPVEIVQIGPGNVPPAHVTQAQPPVSPINHQAPPAAQPHPAVVASRINPDQPADANSNPALQKVARSMGEEIVPAGQAPSGGGSQTEQPNPPKAGGATSVASGTQYQAQPGDSLGRIAAKTLGTSSKAACDAIIALNPSLQSNPNLVIAGRTYNIPSRGNSAPKQTNSDNAPPAPAPVSPADSQGQTADSGNTTPASATPEYFYTVKSGDTLTKIATEQLGSPAAVQAIRDLNQDALNGSDLIRVNQKLRLPAKPLAAAE